MDAVFILHPQHFQTFETGHAFPLPQYQKAAG
jgi:hypothetical protein